MQRVSTLHGKVASIIIGEVEGVGKLGRSKVGLGKVGLGKLGFGKVGR